MNRLLIILVVILIGCKPTSNEEIISTLKETVFSNETSNSRIVHRLEKEVMDEGYRFKDSIFIVQVKSIVQYREKLISKDSLDLYLDYISAHYKQMLKEDPYLTGVDTLKINRANKIKSLFHSQKDSISYYTYLINLLILENDVLKFHAMQYGGCRLFSEIANISKLTDSIKLGAEYSVAVIPDVYYPNESKLIIDSNLTIYRNANKYDLSYKLERIGGVIAIKTRPIEAGEYKINGKFTLKNTRLNFVVPYRFTDKFIVHK